MNSLQESNFAIWLFFFTMLQIFFDLENFTEGNLFFSGSVLIALVAFNCDTWKSQGLII